MIGRQTVANPSRMPTYKSATISTLANAVALAQHRDRPFLTVLTRTPGAAPRAYRADRWRLQPPPLNAQAVIAGHASLACPTEETQ